MTNLIKSFAKSESGAVTVDWVVLTAALVGLGLAVMTVVSNGIEDLSGDISTALADTDPLTNPFATNGADVAGNDCSARKRPWSSRGCANAGAAPFSRKLSCFRCRWRRRRCPCPPPGNCDDRRSIAMMEKSPTAFLESEEGAVMVDWVVLVAALVGLGLAFMAVMSNGVEEMSEALSDELTSIEPAMTPFRTNGAEAAANDPVQD